MPSPLGFVVAIGGTRGKDRLCIADYLKSFGLQPISFIHPWTSVCSDVVLDDCVQIMAGACVSTRVRVGEQTIINHMANVDHECILGRGVHIAPGATLAGCVTVQDRVMIGAGATILPNLTIEEDAIVGAGAVVTKDVDAGSIVIGVLLMAVIPSSSMIPATSPRWPIWRDVSLSEVICDMSCTD